MLYSKIAKPLFFKMDAEKAHHLVIDGLNRAGEAPLAIHVLEALYGVKAAPELSVNLWGIPFSNPIGLAAGLDKDGKAVRAFSSVGFGFVEVGTVTPRPQPGNEQPRLFRLPEDEALINRMGFNNQGARQLADNLRKLPERKVPIAVNIGKNKATPNEQAEDDYRECIQALYPFADFFVVNISSPNTPDLRKLQYGAQFRSLLEAVTDEIDKQHEALGAGAERKHVLVKIAPDVDGVELQSMIETIMDSRISGVIATNTTISRDGLSHANAKETGGLSGKPLTKRSTEVIRTIFKLSEGKLPIIGCGGIFSAEDAYEKIRAGASLLEIYTALIYQGPGINRQLNEGLLQLLNSDGFTHISQAVGADV
jgi:dihydroorotate dehydrogenase